MKVSYGAISTAAWQRNRALVTGSFMAVQFLRVRRPAWRSEALQAQHQPHTYRR
jgi:hypothetical protein